MRARTEWEPLADVVEQRWLQRFGAEPVSGLRDALQPIASQLDHSLPDCMPVLLYGLWTSEERLAQAGGVKRKAGSDNPQLAAARGAPVADEAGSVVAGQLWSLLSRVLLAFALQYEQGSPVSLAIGANLLRVLDDRPTQIRELPMLSGVSKESIEMGLGFLTSRSAVAVESATEGSRWRTARLTQIGLRERSSYHADTAAVEDQWRSRFGEDLITALRTALEPLAEGSDGQPSPLHAGLEPYLDGWRARVSEKAANPRTLPFYPMVLHRGGFPDGS